jgi:hypothetical protein
VDLKPLCLGHIACAGERYVKSIKPDGVFRVTATQRISLQVRKLRLLVFEEIN